MVNSYDIIIIGGGPAGYTAALYAARGGLNTLVVEKFSAGGQMTQTDQIDNYPGFEEGIDGFSLGNKMKQCAERFGAKTIQAKVIEVNLNNTIKEIKTNDEVFSSYVVIIATGATHKHLGLGNEEKLMGKGVGYCAACDGMFYKDKSVIVIGGGNSAAIDALLLSKICKKVIIIHRKDKLTAEKIYRTALLNSKNVEFKYNSIVYEILADNKVSGVKIKNLLNDTEDELLIDGVFICIGRAPQSELFKNQLDIDTNGYIIADETTKTSINGVFAIGDVRTKAFRQIVTAASDGAIASHFAEKYLADIK